MRKALSWKSRTAYPPLLHCRTRHLIQRLQVTSRLSRSRASRHAFLLVCAKQAGDPLANLCIYDALANRDHLYGFAHTSVLSAPRLRYRLETSSFPHFCHLSLTCLMYQFSNDSNLSFTALERSKVIKLGLAQHQPNCFV